MSDLTYSWAPITKSEKQDDGTLLVYGPAASSALDRDQQRLDAAWLDEAMPRWMADDGGAGGAIREQHDSKRAVGIGVGLSKAADGSHMLTARIVDPIAVKKIEYGVLKGFSVGIKNPRVVMGKADAPNGLVTAGDVVEVSVCDRPANPECLFQMAKSDSFGSLELVEDPQVVEKADDTFGLLPELYDRLAAPVKDALAALAAGGAQVEAEVAKSDNADDSPTPVVVNVIVKTADPDVAKGYNTAERKRMADTGQAMSDGSFPIKTKADLRRAIKAVGRGGSDHDEIRAHIAKRAAALGLEAMVPDNWNADGSLKDAQKADAATIEKAEQVLRETRTLAPELAKADDDASDVNETGNEGSDIDGAQAAIAAIATLIIAEAESLAAGNLNEACDISILVSAVESLKWFIAREQGEDQGDDNLMLADDAELLKAAAPKGKNGGKLAPPFKKKDADNEDDSEDDAEDGDDTEDDDADDDEKPAAKKKAAKADAGELLTKADADAAIKAAVAQALAAAAPETSPAETPETVTKADLAEMVKAAVAEATSAAQERTDALAADLAKAEERLSTQADELVKTAGAVQALRDTPLPGGPVLTRTSAQATAAVQTDAARMRAQADELIEKAERFASNPTLAQGYRARARDLLEKASA
jgi:hypothetical protein